MAMERFRRESGQTGDSKDARIADFLDSELENLGADIALPSETKKLEITPFTAESRLGLIKEGLLPDYNLTGQSIASLRKQGNHFFSVWDKDYPRFEAVESIRSAVAFNPDNPFIPKSNDKTFAQQLEMVAEYDRKLQQRVPGVMAILGEAPDWAELIFTHLKATGKYLFGREGGFGSIRTNTRADRLVTDIGDFDATEGLRIGYASSGNRRVSTFAAYLVVPLQV